MSAAIVVALVIGAACRAPAFTPTPTAKLADLDDTAFTEEARKDASAKACPAIVKPWLWRVEKGGRTSHLFGTMHFGVSSDLLPAVVVDAFAKARVVAIESVEELKEDKADASLATQLGPDAWARLQALLGSELAGIVENASATAAIFVLSAMYLDTSATLDDELAEGAKKVGKAVVGLETAADRAPIVEKWLGVRTLRAVLIASRGRRHLRDEALASLASYCAGRDRPEEDRFDDVRAGGFSAAEIRQMQHDLLERRNRAWIAPLEALLAGGDAFIAVGAAHLRGKGSVVDLLQRRGYRVTRVP